MVLSLSFFPVDGNLKIFRENCGDKMDAFLNRTYYVDGGYDNKQGMSKLNVRMEQIEVIFMKSYQPLDVL